MKTTMKYSSRFLILVLVSVTLSGCATTITMHEGSVASSEGNHVQAVEYFKSCVDSEGDSGEYASHCSFLLGKAYFDQRRYPEAVSYLKRAIDVYKKGMFVSKLDPAWYFWLGRAYFENTQYREAAFYFNKAASIAPENPGSLMPADAVYWRKHYLPLIPPKAGSYFWLGTAYHRNSQYQEAISALKRAIELDHAATDFYTMLAASHRELKQYADAVAAAKRSIEIKPSDFAYGVLASIHARQKQYEEAMAAYRKAIELNPKNISHYHHLSNLYSEKEDFSGAIAVNQQAQAAAPENADIPYTISTFYMYMGKYDEAIGSLNRSISLRTMIGVGFELAVEENYPVVKNIREGPAKRAGVMAYDRIIRINGQSTEGWDIDKIVRNIRGAEGSRVVLAIERKGFDKPVEKTVTRETIISKEAAAPLAYRSLAHREKGNLAASYTDAQKAYAMNPDDRLAKSAVSIVFIEQGKYQEACNILSSIKDSPFDRMLEAIAYAKSGNMKKAAEVASLIPEDYLSSQRAIRQSYKKTLVESMKPYVAAKKNNAQSLEAKGQTREALREYSDVLKIVDENERTVIRNDIAALIKKYKHLAELSEGARRHVMRAEVATKEGKFEDAVNEYSEAIKISPYFPNLYKALALTCAELKQYRQAIRHLKTYIDLSPDAADARTARDQMYKWEFLTERKEK